METTQQPRERTAGRGIETVVVAVGKGDDDAALAEEAVAVAGPAGARIVLVHVFEESGYGDVVAALNLDGEGLSTDEVAARHAATREIGDRLADARIGYEVRGTVGDYGEGVVSLAEEVDADRVVVGGRRRSPAGKAVFGSVAQDVLLGSPCPVTLVRAD